MNRSEMTNPLRRDALLYTRASLEVRADSKLRTGDDAQAWDEHADELWGCAADRWEQINRDYRCALLDERLGTGSRP